MYDVVHVGHVKTASRHIGGNHYDVLLRLEAIDVLQTLPLLHLCVERVHVDLHELEKKCYFSYDSNGIGKYDRTSGMLQDVP